MTSGVHDWDDRLTAGESGEELLDELMREELGVEILRVTMPLQKLGLDRVLVSDRPKNDQLRLTSVEYKSDYVGAKTKNCFVEMVSVVERNKLGWAYTSNAEFLVHWIPAPESLAYVVPFRRLRRELDRWREDYQSRTVTSRDPETGIEWHTAGLIVPMHEYERIAQWKLDTSALEARQVAGNL
tara:strand:- start:196 stop:747 length:552 start_codon:yes stop_codon:yes gene_type:complete